jgi:para-aminobenzoate synthetase
MPLAWDGLGTLMAARHAKLPYWGLQFHPESCRSNVACQNIVQHWWNESLSWSFAKSSCSLKSYLVPPGHVWSRPLTPISHAPETNGFHEPQSSRARFAETLQKLTATSRGNVKSQTLGLDVSGSKLAEYCASMSAQNVAMLESVRKGRYSIYAMPSPSDWRLEYSLTTQTCTIYRPDRTEIRFKDKLPHVLDHILALVAGKRARGGDESLPFWGGFIGFFSYEIGLKRLNVTRIHQPPSPELPDISLLWVERSVVLDHSLNEVHVQSIRQNDSDWFTLMCFRMHDFALSQRPPINRGEQLQVLLSQSTITLPNEAIYKSQIRACQSHLRAGDSYELCLTTEARITLPSQPTNPFLLYTNLKAHNPVPFAAYLHLGSITILSSSPEQFLTWSRSTGTIDMIPMKGTVAKSPTMTLAKAKEILASPKESAENLMIADLIRHDLYSTVGWNAKVEVVKLCDVVEHETVYQLVSHIRATPPIPENLTEDETRKEIIHYGHKALRQTLPPGSMTGAPKKRSCEILSRLEMRRRGVYSGVIGYLDVGGGGGFSVCIRSAVNNADEDEDGRQTWRVGAGGAVTVLSDVDAEWEEMRGKMESVLRAFRPDPPAEQNE